MILMYNVRLLYSDALCVSKSYADQDNTQRPKKYRASFLVKNSQNYHEALRQLADKIRVSNKIAQTEGWFKGIEDCDKKYEFNANLSLVTGCHTISATNYARPILKNKDGSVFKDAIEAEAVFTPGVIVNAALDVEAYKHDGKMTGVKIVLHTVQFVKFAEAIILEKTATDVDFENNTNNIDDSIDF